MTTITPQFSIGDSVIVIDTTPGSALQNALTSWEVINNSGYVQPVVGPSPTAPFYALRYATILQLNISQLTTNATPTISYLIQFNNQSGLKSFTETMLWNNQTISIMFSNPSGLSAALAQYGQMFI